MKRENHLKVDRFFWDKEYDDVHTWIDACFPRYVGRNPYHHWLERHHIIAIAKKYGEYTLRYNVAYLHILADFLSHFGVAVVPKDEKEVKEWLITFQVF